MPFDTSIFLGVDLSGGFKPATYAALGPNSRLLALGGGELEDVLAYIAGQRGVVMAVNAPSHTNAGLARQAEIRQSLPALRVAGRSLDLRLAEHKLRQHGINVSMTPSRREMCSSWVQVGFDFYRQIEKLGYLPFPTPDGNYQWLETHPHASFCVLLGQAPMPRTNLEGRLQRQLILHEQGLGIRDPMDYFEEITRHKLLKGALPLEMIYSAEELDAISAAFVAFLAARQPDRVVKVGDPIEGQITLPVKELKQKY